MMAGGIGQEARGKKQYIIFKFTHQTNRNAQKLLKTNFTSVASLNENFVSICLLIFISLSFVVFFPALGLCVGLLVLVALPWHTPGVFCPGSFQLYFFRISFLFYKNKKWSKQKCQRIKLIIHRQNNSVMAMENPLPIFAMIKIYTNTELSVHAHTQCTMWIQKHCSFSGISYFFNNIHM